MSNRERIEIDGIVVDACKAIFKINVSTNDTPNLVSCTLSGKIRQNSVRILVGDKVKIEVSEYNMQQGRIVYRYK